MSNIFDYILWRGDLRFDQAPFNAVDNIIFSRISYLPFDGIVPGPEENEVIPLAEAAVKFARRIKGKSSKLLDQIVMKEDPEFLEAVARSERFRNIGLSRYVNHIDASQEKQFSALTIHPYDGSTFISYRGTDNTLVGWKEDFNMGFMDTVPAQIEAVEYLEQTAAHIRGPLKLGGHSKGGNLAIYAGAFCKKNVQRRITEIYSNDAPGFNPRIISSEGYRRVKDRIHSFVPQGSIIGMFFEHTENYIVVSSVQTGLLQHDVYSWEVLGNDVVRLNTVTNQSKFMDRTLNGWINSLSFDQRQRFTDALYEILCSTDAKTIPELSSQWLKHAGIMLQALTSADKETKELLSTAFSLFIKAARNNFDLILHSDAGAKRQSKAQKKTQAQRV